MPATPSLRASLAAVVVLALSAGAVAAEGPRLSDHVAERFGQPPAIPDGPLADTLRAAVETAFVASVTEQRWRPDQRSALAEVARSGDPRLAWIIADLMRFVSSPDLSAALADAAAGLLAIAPPAQNRWGAIVDHLIAWDIPAPPDYLTVKRAIFTVMVDGWETLFVEGDIDWRHVSWGGVLIDDRPCARTDERCNCIPAADDPKVETAAEARWLADDAVVFGVSINGADRAYPRRIMEVREMVNDTLGGRDLGVPYCTLCGAAQAYFTDGVPAGVERPVLRTSGLLIRSNKVMYDIVSGSVFDTFLGKAVTGPLARIGLRLEQAPVVTTTWGEWKAAHPDTTVLVERLALGRDFDFRNGRDANGPIFPIGDVDPRLPAHEDFVGVVSPTGLPVAFQRSAAVVALRRGEEIAVEGVRLVLDGGCVRAVAVDGAGLGSHQAFRFAWSQFHPDTALWPE